MWNVCAFYKVVNIQFSTHYEKYERNLKPQIHKKADWKNIFIKKIDDVVFLNEMYQRRLSKKIPKLL